MARKLVILLGLLCSGTVAAAQSEKAASNVYIDLNTGFSIVNNSFTNTWDAYPAAHINLRIPFYAGQLESGLRYIRFQGHAPTQTDSDYHSLYFHIGYNYPIKITSWYHIAPTVRVGINFMIFDEVELYTSKDGKSHYMTNRLESEFAYELALRNQFQLSDRWYIHAVLSYNHTLTYFPLPLTLLSVGITYSFPEPGWLKDFIQ